MAINDFAGSSKYYDLMLKKECEKSAKFIVKELKKFKVKTILELGCGTGLYLFPLKKAGFNIEGLDISKEMLDMAKKRGKVKLYKGDMAKFNIKKKYDAVLNLNSSLILLKNHQEIDKSLKCSAKHLNPNGIMILDLPNHVKEIKELKNEQDHSTYKFPGGKIDLISRDYKKGSKWVAEWFGFVQEKNNYSEFTEFYEELIFSPKKLEKSLKSAGFKILRMFGSRTGGKFDPKQSWRRVYLCQLSL